MKKLYAFNSYFYKSHTYVIILYLYYYRLIFLFMNFFVYYFLEKKPLHTMRHQIILRVK